MPNWSNKAVLVTGAAGFIGSHLTEELVKLGARVTAVVHYDSRTNYHNLEFVEPEIRNEIEIVTGNIEDAYFVGKVVQEKQAVFHLAALIGIPYSYRSPLSYVRTNVEGTLNVMQASLSSEVERVVHTSTSETYGTALYAPIDEEHPMQGQSPYSASKIGADKIAESYHLSFDLPVVTIRPFNTYGPRQSARAVIPTIISQALDDGPITLGSLDPVRDLTFVKDTVAGFIRAAEAKDCLGETINLGAGKGITIGELAHKILSLMGCKNEITHDSTRVRPDKSEVMKLICSNEKALKVLDWQPTYSLDDGLAKTIDFVREHQELFKPKIYVE